MSLEAFSEQCLIELSRLQRDVLERYEDHCLLAGEILIADELSRLARNPDRTELEVAA